MAALMIGEYIQITDPTSLHVRKTGIIVARTAGSDKWVARLAIPPDAGASAFPTRIALRRDQFKVIPREAVAAKAKTQ